MDAPMDKRSETTRAFLTCMVTMLESNHKRLDELAEQFFALQNTVRGLDPTFDDVREVKAAEIAAALEKIAPLRKKQYDELCQLIENADF